MNKDPEVKGWGKVRGLRTPSRRLIRRRTRRAETVTRRHIHRFISSRWQNARAVRRAALVWLLLVGVLLGLSSAQGMLFRTSYSTQAAASGGTYIEAVLGPLDSFNPIYAQTSAEKSASKLIFGSLLSYDRWGELRGDLALSWQPTEDGRGYRVVLRDDVYWHDGQKFTADDVVFTVSLMKNPQARSSLYSSWQGVTVSKQSDREVVFSLPSVYAPFPHALTFGVLPEHLLASMPVGQIRESSFSRQPVGTGPFEMTNLQIIDVERGEVVLHLQANDDYFRGRPRLDRFHLHVYDTRDAISQAFIQGQVNAAADLGSSQAEAVNEGRSTANIQSTPLNNGVYALFKSDSGLLADVEIRKALRLAIDRQVVRGVVGGVGPLEGPLVDEMLPNSSITQPLSDMAAAGQMLDAAGWSNQDGVRSKDGLPLEISVVAPDNGNYDDLVEYITNQWEELGVKVLVRLTDPRDIQQTALLSRAYDVLLYEMALGGDPDVYAYWHSSQSIPTGLNLSNYNSDIVDDALSSARTRIESDLRRAKYESFSRSWIQDAPAIALYRTSLQYATSQSTRSYADTPVLVDTISRYHDVENWTVYTESRQITP